MKIFLYVLIFSYACSKKEESIEVSYDHNGKMVLLCSVRDAEGRGPYEPIKRVNEAQCERLISQKCRKKKYKQIHRNGGHFARGKFGKKILIGTCP